MGIRAKLVLCLLAALVPLTAVSAFAIRLVDQQLTERTESALANTQRLEAARITEILGSYAQYARGLAEGHHVKDFVAATNTYRQARLNNGDVSEFDSAMIGGFDGFAIINPAVPWPLQQLALALQRKAGILGSAVVELRLVDRQGATLGESLGFSWTPTDPTLIQRSMRTVKTTFGDAFRNIDNHERLGIVSPIIGESGEVVGALIMESRLNPITDLVAKHEGVGYSSEAHIAQPTPDGDAQFITALRFDRKAAFNKVVAEHKNLPINAALDAYGGRILQAKDYRGVESILAVETIPNTGWGLVVKIDTAEAYAPVIKLRRILGIAALASISFVLASYMFCFVPLAHRLKRTSNTAKKVMNGDLTARVSDKNNDEIGHMARIIDSLARDLENDQKKRIEVEARLRYQALHDELTGLFNRKHANKVIQQLNDDVRAVHSVMFLDLNGFKDVNDLYGHATGDEVLITVAQRLSKEISNSITLARWGGDEFVVILPDVDEVTATEFALSIHNAFDELFITNQGTHSISCSIGLATSSDTKSLDDVLVEADTLMYEQKKRQHFQRSKGGMATRTVERALSEERIEVWYQPMVRIQKPGNYNLTGAEALVRLRSRDGGIVLPADFLTDVRTGPLGGMVDKKVVSQSIHALSRWLASGVVNQDFKMSINISEQAIDDPSFLATLSDELQLTGVKGKQIILELPEKTQHSDYTIMAELRAQGISIALDSVGAEPVNLGRFSTLKPDLAKIDRQWLSDPVVLPHLVSICKELKVDIVAEGIETREQLCLLHELGIQQFQGYLFDKPLRAVDFVSRWGQTSMESLGKSSILVNTLRLAG